MYTSRGPRMTPTVIDTFVYDFIRKWRFGWKLKIIAAAFTVIGHREVVYRYLFGPFRPSLFKWERKNILLLRNKRVLRSFQIGSKILSARPKQKLTIHEHKRQ